MNHLQEAQKWAKWAEMAAEASYPQAEMEYSAISIAHALIAIAEEAKGPRFVVLHRVRTSCREPGETVVAVQSVVEYYQHQSQLNGNDVLTVNLSNGYCIEVDLSDLAALDAACGVTR